MHRLSVLLVSTLLVLACDDDPAGPGIDAEASTDRSSYSVADTVEVSVTNRSGDVIYVRACGSGGPTFMVQRREGGEWVHHDATVCGGPTFVDLALEPDASLSTEIEPGHVFTEAGTYRVGLDVTDDPDSGTLDYVTLFTGSFTVE